VCVVVVELHVTVKYIKIWNVALSGFMVNLCHHQQLKLYVPVSEINHTPTNFAIFSHIT
jgi:hypothetical protein